MDSPTLFIHEQVQAGRLHRIVPPTFSTECGAVLLFHAQDVWPILAHDIDNIADTCINVNHVHRHVTDLSMDMTAMRTRESSGKAALDLHVVNSQVRFPALHHIHSAQPRVIP